MNEMIIQPNSRGVPTDMVLLFVCSKPHSQRRQQFGSRHFQRQAAGCANTIAASSAVWKSPFSKAGCGLRQHHPRRRQLQTWPTPNKKIAEKIKRPRNGTNKTRLCVV
jgi:hypothetical protein